MKFVYKITVVLCGFFVSSACQAQAPGLCERAGAALRETHKIYNYPGAVLAISLPDDSECVMAVGVADRETGAPMRPESRLLAASIGKTFVAAVALKLSFEGKINLDDPISKWLGDEPFYRRLPNGDKITIRHLMSHTSGLTDHVHDAAFAKASGERVGKDHPFHPQELIEFILDDPALFEPGQGYAYTDTGYILLGLIIEKASGRTFYNMAQEFFLDPMGLRSTSPSTSRRLKGLVPGYMSPNNFRGFPQKTIGEDGKLVWNPKYEWTGGGFVSNAQDLARWVHRYFSGKAMAHDYLDDAINGSPYKEDGGAMRYGLGASVVQTPFGEMLGHGGWIPGYRSAAFYFPNHDISYALQVNTDIGLSGEENHFQELNGIILQAIFKEQP